MSESRNERSIMTLDWNKIYTRYEFSIRNIDVLCSGQVLSGYVGYRYVTTVARSLLNTCAPHETGSPTPFFESVLFMIH